MVKKVFAALFFLLFLALPAFAEEAPALPPEIGALTEKMIFKNAPHRFLPVSLRRMNTLSCIRTAVIRCNIT